MVLVFIFVFLFGVIFNMLSHYFSHTPLVFGPNIPSGDKLLFFWKRVTEALVFVPKMPSMTRPFRVVCRHFTWSPLVPNLRVSVMEQCGVGGGVVCKEVQGNPVTVLKRVPAGQTVSMEV